MQTTDNQTAHGPASSDVDPTNPAADLGKDLIFEILKNQRRRTTLEYLRANDGAAELGDLAEHIAALENGVEVAELTSSERKRVYIGLYQCHLPKMDDAGVIEYDQNRGRIGLSPAADLLFPYLDIDPTQRSRSGPGDAGQLRSVANRFADLF